LVGVAINEVVKKTMTDAQALAIVTSTTNALTATLQSILPYLLPVAITLTVLFGALVLIFAYAKGWFSGK